jgi:pimeloyl-ACP methyl ester carboxylesterase
MYLKGNINPLDMKKTHFLISIFLLASIVNSSAQKSFVVEKTGKGQPILLFPGFACTSDVFDGFKEELKQDHELHSFTFAGFGGIPPIGFPWLPQIKEEIEIYINDNNLQNPIIIGHSLGGTLGLWLLTDSDKYSKLIIIDALPAMGALMIPDYNSENIEYDNPYNSQVLEMDEEAFRNMAIQSALYMTKDSEKQQLIANWMMGSDRKTYVYGYTDLLKLDLRGDLKNINSPVFILAATEPYGKDVAESNYRKQYKNLKDYSLKFAEGSNHFIMYDQPEWLRRQIQSVLITNE